MGEQVGWVLCKPPCLKSFIVTCKCKLKSIALFAKIIQRSHHSTVYAQLNLGTILEKNLIETRYIPKSKTEDNSLEDSTQIQFTQWRDASAKCDGPIKSLPCDVKWRCLQVIFWKYFQSGLTQKIVSGKKIQVIHP